MEEYKTESCDLCMNQSQPDSGQGSGFDAFMEDKFGSKKFLTFEENIKAIVAFHLLSSFPYVVCGRVYTCVGLILLVLVC